MPLKVAIGATIAAFVVVSSAFVLHVQGSSLTEFFASAPHTEQSTTVDEAPRKRTRPASDSRASTAARPATVTAPATDERSALRTASQRAVDAEASLARQAVTNPPEAPRRPVRPAQHPPVDASELASLRALIARTLTGTGNEVDAGLAELQRRIEASPGQAGALLETFGKLPGDDREKALIQTLLASSSQPSIEAHAVAQLAAGSRVDSRWLDLLRQRGVHSREARVQLIDILPSLRSPEALGSAIRALKAGIVSPQERDAVVIELRRYASNEHDEVRGAAIEAVGQWGDPMNADVIEDALFDSAPSVRRAALFAAFTSTIRTPAIKDSLLEIMTDSSEDWSLRMDAYSALSSYTLEGTQYDEFFHFDQQRQAVHGADDGRS